MTIANGSFEAAEPLTAGLPYASAIPAGLWVFGGVSTEEDWADFGTTLVSTFPLASSPGRESFEEAWPFWGSTDALRPAVLAFSSALLAAAIFDVGVAQTGREDFERGWSLPGGSQGEFELGGSESALFDGGTLAGDGFEVGWGSLGLELPVGASRALFGVALGAEGFEGGWRGNEASYVSTLVEPATSPASFASGSFFSAFENFEASLPPYALLSAVAATDFVSVDDGADFANGDRVFFEIVVSDQAATLPSPLLEETPYYVTAASNPHTFKVEAQPGGGVIDLTDGGTGAVAVTADIARFWAREL